MKTDYTEAELTVPVTEFKAKCLDILARLGRRSLVHVTVTRHGHPLAELYPPRSADSDLRAFFADMAGTVIVPPRVDLTEPIIDMTEWDDDPLESRR